MKRLKSTLEVKSGFNKSGRQDFFETRVYREKLIRSIYENTRVYLFEKRIQNSAMVDAIEPFVRNHVFIDAVYVHTERNPETGTVSGVFGSNISDGKHVVRNGLSQNVRDRRGINSIRTRGVIPTNAMVVVFVSDYLHTGVHRNHALAAFKHDNVLFCFNPWGEAYVGQNVPDDIIWETLRKEYRCPMKVVYTGPNFQAQNTNGACLGLSVDFGSYMYNHLFRTEGTLKGVSRYNTLVPQLFETYVGAFGDYRSKCRLSDVMTRLTSNTVVVQKNNHHKNHERFRKNTRNLPILQNVLNLSNKNKSFRHLLKEPNSIKVQMLREHNPSLRSVHANRIHADIRRYKESGDIPVFPRNTAVPMNVD